MKFVYDRAGLNETNARRALDKLRPYLSELRRAAGDELYATDESSLHLPDDRATVKSATELARKIGSKKLKYIVVVGIGGSNLGCKTVYDAQYGFLDILRPSRYPKILFADTTHPEFLAALSSLVSRAKSADEIAVNSISKSGTTTETAANTEAIMRMMKLKFGASALNRLVVTTDRDSRLWKIAGEKGTARLEIPRRVGGRYSILSAVGLFPLALAGINVKNLLAGARGIRAACLKSDARNPALVSSAAIAKHYRRGKNICDTFVFHPELETLGKWYRQLLGESIGKTSEVGITPTVTVGSTDLHSVGQLYLAGPKDRFTAFVWSEKDDSGVALPDQMLLPAVKGLSGVSIGRIRRAILHGVKRAYEKKRLPFTETVLSDLSPRSLGEFMQFKMIEVMLLAKLLKVNAFDQPAVELYKKETRRILSNP